MTLVTDNNPSMTSVDVRSKLVEALKLDLIGPWAGHPQSDERLNRRPSSWYLTGFLIPSGTLLAKDAAQKSADADENEEVEEIPQSAGVAEESSEDRKAAKKGFYPSSIGLSFLVQKETTTITVKVRWGDYVIAETPGDDGKPISVWQRKPNEVAMNVELRGSRDPVKLSVPGSNGLQLQIIERLISTDDVSDHIPSGTRSVSIFLVNNREVKEIDSDLTYAFQAQIEVHCKEGFVPRPDLRGLKIKDDWDEQVGDLHYADTPEYGTGHGVSTEWDISEKCHILRTEWIPSAEVEKTEPVNLPEIELSMEALGSLPNGAAAEKILRPLITQYRSWIESKRTGSANLSGTRKETATQLLALAKEAADRIEEGISVLSSSADALDAFCVANRSVARALRKRLKNMKESPKWYAFQLAFILLNLPGLADPHNRHRETVDLLFFPTGGGKTEAYLGLAAFAMVLRRLRHPNDKGLTGAGVSVIMRYTLRLLTLDQLARASGLICALDLERQQNAAKYGDWPFEIGLWVGKAATPNILGYKGENRSDSARTLVRRYKASPKSNRSPIPLENCPWCNTPFTPDSFRLLPNDDHPLELRIFCADPKCDFTRDSPLPIVTVDESIYRRLPSFLIATVDKFATLPWVGQVGVLLGGAERQDANGFYGAADPRKGKRLTTPLAPPDLVIQDELHLISGPLGTMTGLYEAAINALCVREIDGRATRPKIVASTATVRRAQDQIQALFGRGGTQVFPPPGPNRRDSFFARTVSSTEIPARLYVGIASQGRNPKATMRRAWLALMGSAERAYRDAGGQKNPANSADPYMTVIGYFNSLRELGGARRILEEEVQLTLKSYGERKRVGENEGLFCDRKTFSEVMELTSRVPMNEVAQARRRLDCPFQDSDHVDCAIATNMISVGLDIPRLGLMVVFGQPKTHSEYIQATSRVGRDDKRPGLVITVFGFQRPRDRSHYERFRHYHETFYRSVEVGSVTPFSARALDRGFAGALVGLARHVQPELEPPEGVQQIPAVRQIVERKLLDAFLQRVGQQPFTEEGEREERLRSIQNRVVDLLDSWRKIFEDYRSANVRMQYQEYELDGPKPLLREMLDKDFDSEDHKKFRVMRSLRDVEPDVNIFLNDFNGRPVEENA